MTDHETDKPTPPMDDRPSRAASQSVPTTPQDGMSPPPPPPGSSSEPLLETPVEADRMQGTHAPHDTAHDAQRGAEAPSNWLPAAPGDTIVPPPLYDVPETSQQAASSNSPYGFGEPGVFDTVPAAASSDAGSAQPTNGFPAPYGVPPSTTVPASPYLSATPEPPAASGVPAVGNVPPQPPRPRRQFGAGTLIGTALAAAAISGLLAGLLVGGLTGAFAPKSGASESSTSAPAAAQGGMSAAIERIRPSTVQIDVQTGTSSELGSGVVVSSDGLVLTNAHVVTADGTANNAKVRVTTAGGRVYDATPVGIDPLVDLALIKLNGASNLVPAEFADSSTITAGAPVLAMGSPLGLSESVSQGIVSSTERSIDVRSPAAPEGDPATAPYAMEQYRPSGEGVRLAVIQSDVSVNPGNSGGPLIDANGRVVGINVAIASGSKGQGTAPRQGESGSIGISFSIPSNVAQRIANELQTTPYPSHGSIGASLRDQPAAAAQGGFVGALVNSVEPGRAAAKAGLHEGDVITQINAVQVRESADVAAQIRALPAGTVVTIRVVRGGQTVDLSVTLDALEH